MAVNSGYACEKAQGESVNSVYFPPKFDSIDPENDYVFQLLELVLEKSQDKFGKCQARLLDYKLPLKRVELYLEKNAAIQVAAFTVSVKRDERFLPVPVPISKGLMGYRLLMIKQGDAEHFANIQTLNDLSAYTAGQGIGWADADILKRNGLPVITAGSIKTLIDMLAHSRFDYFPRGALQIITELETYREKPVQIEQSLALSYPSMTAFYVNANNTALAERLEYGLNQAVSDGSFDRFFYQHPSSIDALKNINLAQRKILKICNPILPTWVPIEKHEYWLEPWPQRCLDQAELKRKRSKELR
ncbi:type 2 periplasmic-binding domain-containing protein [Saccharobesus litoralis]|nr:diguanylate cyclase [Saccharobesus litoralis]